MKKIYQLAVAFLFVSGASFAQSNGDLNFNASESAVVSGQNGVTIGIENLNLDNDVNIYSFDNQVFVNTSNLNGAQGTIEIYNVAGKLIVSERINEALQTIAVNSNSSALYIVKVASNNKVYTKKVFIK